MIAVLNAFNNEEVLVSSVSPFENLNTCLKLLALSPSNHWWAPFSIGGSTTRRFFDATTDLRKQNKDDRAICDFTKKQSRSLNRIHSQVFL